MIYTHDRREAARAPRTSARKVTYPPPLNTPVAWGSFDRYLTSRGCDPEIAKRHGWYPSEHAGDDQLRVVIPAPWSNGTPYWQARCLVEDQTPRYLSPNASRGDGLVVVYAIPIPSDPVYVVVEGPIDALALASWGVVGIGLMGNHPPATVWERIRSLARGHRVILYPDSDAIAEAAGWLTQLRKYGILAEYCAPIGKDFADLTLTQRKEVVASWELGRR